MFLRGDCTDIKFPGQVTAKAATDKDAEEIRKYVSEYCDVFGYDTEEVMNASFTVVTQKRRSSSSFRRMMLSLSGLLSAMCLVNKKMYQLCLMSFIVLFQRALLLMLPQLQASEMKHTLT